MLILLYVASLDVNGEELQEEEHDKQINTHQSVNSSEDIQYEVWCLSVRLSVRLFPVSGGYFPH